MLAQGMKMLVAGLSLFNVNHSFVLRSKGEHSSGVCTQDMILLTLRSGQFAKDLERRKINPLSEDRNETIL